MELPYQGTSQLAKSANAVDFVQGIGLSIWDGKQRLPTVFIQEVGLKTRSRVLSVVTSNVYCAQHC